jgi:transposase
MIKMAEKQEIIIRYYREGKSARSISRELGLSRKTVSKYISQYESTLAQRQHNSEQVLDACLITPPRYQTKNRSKRCLSAVLQQRLDEYWQQNQQKKQQGLRKQILLKQDIYQALQQEGFQVGYTTVCNYLRGKAKPAVEVFIRQEYEPASSCEFDWAEVRLQIAGRETRLYLAVFTSSYSNYRFALLFNRQDTLAFLESHVAFFAHCQGVFHQMVYDNMRVAVAQFTSYKEREPTLALGQLSSHYRYRFRFCNIAKGNEKGHVERSVEYVRRKAFGNNHCFENLHQAQQHLTGILAGLNATVREGKSAQALFDAEKRQLWPDPGQMACYLLEHLKVDKQATVCYKTNHYSVPDQLVGCMLEVKVQAEQLTFFHQGQQVATHSRSYQRHHWQMKLEHYLTTLGYKPGALAGATAFKQSHWPLQKFYQQYFREDARSFIHLLQYCHKHQISQGQLLETAQELSRYCPTDVTADKLMALLGNQPCQPVAAAAKGIIEERCEAQLREISTLFNP